MLNKLRPHIDRQIQFSILAGRIATHQNQVTVFHVERNQPAEFPRCLGLFCIHDVIHHPADRGWHINGRIDPHLGLLP